VTAIDSMEPEEQNLASFIYARYHSGPQYIPGPVCYRTLLLKLRLLELSGKKGNIGCSVVGHEFFHTSATFEDEMVEDEGCVEMKFLFFPAVEDGNFVQVCFVDHDSKTKRRTILYLQPNDANSLIQYMRKGPETKEGPRIKDPPQEDNGKGWLVPIIILSLSFPLLELDL
jgi:hypothetical protein